MQITHIMADGSVRESVNGMKIPKKIYEKIKEVRSKKNDKEEILQS